jgi:hypothetical protein
MEETLNKAIDEARKVAEKYGLQPLLIVFKHTGEDGRGKLAVSRDGSQDEINNLISLLEKEAHHESGKDQRHN